MSNYFNYFIGLIIIGLVGLLYVRAQSSSNQPSTSSDTKKKESFSDRKIECSHAPYGYTFDYIKQKKERLYGVPLCCQNIF